MNREKKIHVYVHVDNIVEGRLFRYDLSLCFLKEDLYKDDAHAYGARRSLSYFPCCLFVKNKIQCAGFSKKAESAATQ